MELDNNPLIEGRLTRAYNNMMQRTRHFLQTTNDHQSSMTLEQALTQAADKSIESGELTPDEANRIANFLRRDISDAAIHLAEPGGSELSDWLRFDIQRVEDHLIELFFSVADQTKLELIQLAQPPLPYHTYRTGEITSIGSLECAQCGQQIQFHETDFIPPCPQCHSLIFRRSGRS